MENVFLGIGSNVGDRMHFLAEAVRKLRAIPTLRVMKISSVYVTEPVGVKDQNEYLNAVVSTQTSAGVTDFHLRIKSIEKEIGRVERERWGPREIDIDILLFGDRIISEAAITIPHAEMVNRRFVLQPLAEISPETVHPLLHKTVRDLLAECKDSSVVECSAQLTQSFLTTLQE